MKRLLLLALLPLLAGAELTGNRNSATPGTLVPFAANQPVAFGNHVACSTTDPTDLVTCIAEMAGADWTTGSAAPSGGSDGDWYLRTGSTSPGIYYRASGSWGLVMAPGTGGGGGGAPGAGSVTRAALA